MLKNFVTQIYVGRTVANSLLNFLEDVTKRFNEFYAKVYVDKVSLFHEKISRYNLPQLDDVNEELPNNSLKSRQFMEKESQKPMKSLMIAKDKNSGGIDTILQHDLSSKSVLFDGNLMKKANNKSQLISELEKYFEVNDYLIDLSERQTVIVDFMSVTRSMKTTKEKFPLFKDLFIAIYDNVMNISDLNQLHFIFDSYLSHTLKSSEHLHRKSIPIELATIKGETPKKV